MIGVSPPPDEILEEWTSALAELGAQIAAWSVPLGWQVSYRSADPIQEEELPPYKPTILRVQDGAKWIEFEPTARLIQGGAGRVDIYSPLHHLTMMRRTSDWPIRDADWTVYAPGLFPIVRTWNEGTFRYVVDGLFSEQDSEQAA